MNLSVSYLNSTSELRSLDNINFTLEAGKTLGIVGESGSGKSTIALALMGLLNNKQNCKISGEVKLEGLNLLTASERHLRSIRGNKISVIFQDHLSSFSPVYTCGQHILEIIKHQFNGITDNEAKNIAYDTLKKVELNIDILKKYPHQISGGMRQRVLLAMATMGSPRVLIADEPTSALDANLQMQMLQLIKTLQNKNNSSLILISHDINQIIKTCDHVATIYAGKVIEYTTVNDSSIQARHPYTKGLMRSAESQRNSISKMQIYTIPEQLPQQRNKQILETDKTRPRCSFAPRCPSAQEICWNHSPTLNCISPQ